MPPPPPSVTETLIILILELRPSGKNISVSLKSQRLLNHKLRNHQIYTDTFEIYNSRLVAINKPSFRSAINCTRVLC